MPSFSHNMPGLEHSSEERLHPLLLPTLFNCHLYYEPCLVVHRLYCQHKERGAFLFKQPDRPTAFTTLVPYSSVWSSHSVHSLRVLHRNVLVDSTVCRRSCYNDRGGTLLSEIKIQPEKCATEQFFQNLLTNLDRRRK